MANGLEAEQRQGEPSWHLCAAEVMPMHVKRLRKLPTISDRASLSAFGRITRGYQFDSPSKNASLPGPQSFNNGP